MYPVQAIKLAIWVISFRVESFGGLVVWACLVCESGRTWLWGGRRCSLWRPGTRTVLSVLSGEAAVAEVTYKGKVCE